MAAKIISTVQMKGGVGKTNCAVNLASVLSAEYQKKVLVVDFDPQTNATLSLISENRWKSWDKTNGTMADLFGMKGQKKGSAKQTINDYIIKDVNEKIPGLHLLPSHLKMTFIDSQLTSKPARERIFKQAIDALEEDYDYILCDCPPNLLTVTQNALYASSYFLVPLQPDFLSTLGVELLLNRIAYLKKSLQLRLKCLGMIFTRVRDYVDYHTETMKTLPMESKFSKLYFFENFIPETIKVSEAASQNLPINLYKHSSRGSEAFIHLGREFLERIGDLK